MLKTYFKKIHNQSKFNSGIICFFINTVYFSRKNLHYFFKKYSSEFKGIVLDFGAGESPYKKMINCSKYITLDIEQSGHNNKNNNINYFYDGKKIPFDDNYFDVIISTQVFEHVLNLDEIILELNRVLKKGGKMYLTVPFCWEEHEIPYDFYRFTSYGMKSFLEKNGFKIIKFEKSGNYIEVIFQYVICYINGIFLSIKNKILRKFFFPLRMFFIFFFNFLGTLFVKILPKNEKIYFDNIILARKK